MDESLIVIVILAAVITFVVVMIFWTLTRSQTILDQWADQNEFEILDADFRWFWRGPFFWRCSKGQTVYRITITDSDGEIRQGWVRCGSFWLGIWTDRADVKWD